MKKIVLLVIALLSFNAYSMVYSMDNQASKRSADKETTEQPVAKRACQQSARNIDPFIKAIRDEHTITGKKELASQLASNKKNWALNHINATKNFRKHIGHYMYDDSTIEQREALLNLIKNDIHNRADVNVIIHGQRALILAVLNQNSDLLKLLLTDEVVSVTDINVLATALINALRYNYTASIALFMLSKRVISRGIFNCDTVVEYAAKWSTPEIVELLLTQAGISQRNITYLESKGLRKAEIELINIEAADRQPTAEFLDGIKNRHAANLIILKKFLDLEKTIATNPTHNLLEAAVTIGNCRMVKKLLRVLPVDYDKEMAIAQIAKNKSTDARHKNYQIIGALLRQRLGCCSDVSGICKNGTLSQTHLPAEIQELIIQMMQ